MPRTGSSKTPAPSQVDNGPAMPFNEALKRVWSAPPAPKVKARTGPVKRAAKG